LHAAFVQFGWHPMHASPVQVVPLPHSAQGAPCLPQALALVPGMHVLPLQHPAHPLWHSHVPLWHAVPVGHVPVLQVPPHPSGAPHALPAHCGVHEHM
jgi:hypothetical protein